MAKRLFCFRERVAWSRQRNRRRIHTELADTRSRTRKQREQVARGATWIERFSTGLVAKHAGVAEFEHRKGADIVTTHDAETGLAIEVELIGRQHDRVTDVERCELNTIVERVVAI